MTDEQHPDSRMRILAAAAELFVSKGYVETSVREIGAAVGLTKAAVLYHFPAKDLILAELAEPMLSASERVLDAAESLAPRPARQAVVEGILDVTFAHLRVLAIANAAWIVRDPIYRRVVAINERAQALIAGPEAGLREQIRASGALALLARPALFHREHPAEEVRREILEAVARLFDDDSPERPRPAPVDRRRALTPAKLAEVRRLQSEGDYSVSELAAAVGVSRATLYRHLAQ